MAKWKETTKTAKTSTEALVPYQTVITHKPDGTIEKIDTYYNYVRIFDDGAVLNRYAGSVQVIVAELSQPNIAFANNIDKAIQKLIGDRLPVED